MILTVNDTFFLVNYNVTLGFLFFPCLFNCLLIQLGLHCLAFFLRRIPIFFSLVFQSTVISKYLKNKITL